MSASAATFTLTFDADDPIGGLAVNSILSNQYAVITGATFSPNGFTGLGGPKGQWATNTDMTIVSSTGDNVGAAGLGSTSLVSGNILRGNIGFIHQNGDPSFRITFATTIDSFSATFAGVGVGGDPNKPANTRIFAYNGNNLLGTVAASVFGQQTLSISGAGTITSVVLTPGDAADYVAVDNITFNTVPEPGSAALLGLGLAAGLWLAPRGRR